jgi:hypothetical protein
LKPQSEREPARHPPRFAARSTHDLIELTARVQPLIDKAGAYGRALADMVNDGRASLAQTTEARLAGLRSSSRHRPSPT